MCTRGQSWEPPSLGLCFRRVFSHLGIKDWWQDNLQDFYSKYSPFHFSAGWESQLLETGFLGMFLCPLWTLSRLPRSTPPSSIVIWGFRWLIFRIMLGAVSGALWLGFWVLSLGCFVVCFFAEMAAVGTSDPSKKLSLGQSTAVLQFRTFLVRRKELGVGNASCSVLQSRYC